MCNIACMQFARSNLSRDEIAGKSVIEVGALDVNGSLRTIIENLDPLRYLGVDIADGPGVDELCDINELSCRYGKDSFDVVISTEILEHVRNWRRAASNLKRILRPDGSLLLTTRSKGFGFHGHPFDFWRYEVEDLRTIFSDLQIEVLERDSSSPGVFIKAKKLATFSERFLETHELYSMVRRRRCKDVRNIDILHFKFVQSMSRFLSPILPASVRAGMRKAIRRNE
jgi:SAM-dependent methyltransferase